jgi:hypothetical protein
MTLLTSAAIYTKQLRLMCMGRKTRAKNVLVVLYDVREMFCN